MSQWPHKPFIYELNTWVWLTQLSQQTGQPMTLASIPDGVLDALAQANVDALWLMGIWQRNPAGRQSALNYIHEYEQALPDVTADDVIGSAYAIGDYQVDARLGGREALAQLRQRLHERGLKLILDFVPNHVATDHPWVAQQPTCFVRANAREYKQHHSLFFATQDAWGRTLYIAHGRDPYFPPWIDTAQLNAFSADFRQTASATLLDIASQCDGVRCDMAMLMLNSVFANTWGDYLDEDLPEVDFWLALIPQIKAAYPDFIFIAEVYWGLEGTLMQQGFDFLYDKTLYDRIVSQDAPAVYDHLLAPLDFQAHSVRFIENHDEPRARAALGIDQSKSAAVLTFTLPGATLLHDGQFTGRTIKLPVQIKRQPEEPINDELLAFYQTLLAETRANIYQTGVWQLFEVAPSVAESEEHSALLAHGWREGNDNYRIIIANLSDEWAKGVINLNDWPLISVDNWCLHDVLSNVYYYRDGQQLTNEGLFVELAPNKAQILRFERVIPGQSPPCQA